MTTFDSVAPDAAAIVHVPAKIFRPIQTWAPFTLHGLAVIFYVITLCISYNTHRQHTAKVLLLFCFLFVLLASFLRRLSPYLFSEIGCYRYNRVESVATQLLPNTRQSWIVVMSLAAMTVCLPLYIYLFTHYTHDKVVYGFAMLGLSTGPWHIFSAVCIGLLLCGGIVGALFVVVMLPCGTRNPLYVAAPQDRVRIWIRLVSWFPLTLLLLILFVCSRALLCNGPLGRFSSTDGTEACGSAPHSLCGCFAWLFIAAGYIGLDVGIAYVRLLGGGPFTYYALEPRLDGLFSELLVWSLKVTVAMVTLADPIAAYLVVSALFCGLVVFSCTRRTSTVMVLEGLIRGVVAVVAVTCFASLLFSSRRLPAWGPGILVPICWIGAVGSIALVHVRLFGWKLFSSGREVTADIIVL